MPMNTTREKGSHYHGSRPTGHGFSAWLLCLTFGLMAVLPAATFGETLIDEGVTWEYLDDGSNQGTAWRDSGFDDSSWASGPAKLRYGDGDEATVVSFGGNSEELFYL